MINLKLNGILILYADDAVPIYFHTDPHILNEKIQEDLNTIASWLTENELSVNANKTKYMLNSKSNQHISNTDFTITLGPNISR